MGIIAAIFGKPGAKKADALGSAADVTQSLARLEAERAEARRTINDALVKRKELLAVDGSDKQIAALDAAVDTAHLILERLETVEPSLHARLREFQSEARRARLAELEAQYSDVVTVLDGAMSIAADALDDYLETVDVINREGFGSEGRLFLVTPPMVGHAIVCGATPLENWRAERDRNAAMRAGVSPISQIPCVSPEQAAANIAARKAPERARLQDPLYRPGPRRAPRKIIDAPSFGFAKVIFLRNGVEIDDEARVIGDEMIVSNDVADRLGRAGAVDIVERGEIGRAAE